MTPTASAATARKCENKFSRITRLARFFYLKGMNLAGKKILLGVSGGIAVYKSCELLRLLQKKGAEVRVCMTDAATEFVAPLTFASLSKCPVYLKNGAVEARPFQHIDFPRWADLYLVVPATANVIGKFACGIADDPVSLCFMSCTCPRVIAPAMNVAMYNSPAVKRNLEILRSFENTTVLESPAGELACGEVGQGRLMEPAEIVKWLEGASLPLAAAACASSATPSCGGVPRNAPAPACPVAKDIDPTQDATLPGFGKKVLLTAKDRRCTRLGFLRQRFQRRSRRRPDGGGVPGRSESDPCEKRPGHARRRDGTVNFCRRRRALRGGSGLPPRPRRRRKN